MENSFYIPINSGSLAHYFSRAIILPAKYFSNKPEDIQNTVSDFILVSENKWVKNSDCTLEVILTELEVKALSRVSEHFLFCNTPIPISRVKSVCFLDVKQKETTIWNINNGAAFIPERIVSVENNNNIDKVSNSEFKSWKEANLAIESSDQIKMPDLIKRFDTILGGFAFMRLGGESFMNYSPSYFSTLSYFNAQIKEQTENAEKEKGFKFSEKYFGLFSKKIEGEWSDWRRYVFSESITIQDIILIAEEKKLIAEKNYLGVLKFESISPSTHLYDFAILATYGDGKSKSTENLVTDLTNGTINAEKAEDISILFGLNSGYSKLRNKYKGSVKDSNVKFALESKLDYYTIESIFQFVFYGSKTSYSFDYIDKWCPTSKDDNIEDYETYKILDTFVIAKKKKTLSEERSEYSQEYSECFQEYFQALQRIEAQTHEELQRIEAQRQRIEAQRHEALQSEIDKLKLSLARLEKWGKLSPVIASKKEIEEANINPVSSFQKPVASEVSDNLSSLSITDLKKVAKQRGIPNNKLKEFKKENIAELITLIKKTPESSSFL